MCGSCARLTTETEIKRIHKYLMVEWKINEKPGLAGPAGKKGYRGAPGVSGLSSICRYFPTKTIECFREAE